MTTPPRREDIPENVDGGDILYELRQFEYKFDRWAHQHGPALAFADKLRSVWADAVFVMRLVSIPVLLAAVVWLAGGHT